MFIFSWSGLPRLDSLRCLHCLRVVVRIPQLVEGLARVAAYEVTTYIMAGLIVRGITHVMSTSPVPEYKQQTRRLRAGNTFAFDPFLSSLHEFAVWAPANNLSY
jgi:hypothetical protein